MIAGTDLLNSKTLLQLKEKWKYCVQGAVPYGEYVAIDVGSRVMRGIDPIPSSAVIRCSTQEQVDKLDSLTTFK